MEEGHTMGKSKSEPREAAPPILLKRSPRTFHVPYPKDGKAPSAHGRIQAQDIYTVYPGVNPPADPDVWARVGDAVRKYVEDERAAPRNDDPFEDEIRGIRELSDIPAEAAKLWVERCGHLDNLRWWRDNETRAHVRARVERQIELIEERAASRRKAS